MSLFKSTNENKAKGKVKKVFEDIKKNRKISKIPNFWKSLAHNPDNLERTWNNLNQIMKKGALDLVTKELIYVAVSITNNCDYCIRSHTAAAKKKGAIFKDESTCYVEGELKVGKDVRIGSNVTIKGKVTLGNDVCIESNVLL